MLNWNENKYVRRLGANYSRIVASFIGMGGNPFNRLCFTAWLTEVLHFDDGEAYDIYEFATCGKMELEMTVRPFLKKYKEEDLEDLE